MGKDTISMAISTIAVLVITKGYSLHWLVVWNMFYVFRILGIIIPIDFHIFQRGRAQPPTSTAFPHWKDGCQGESSQGPTNHEQEIRQNHSGAVVQCATKMLSMYIYVYIYTYYNDMYYTYLVMLYIRYRYIYSIYGQYRYYIHTRISLLHIQKCIYPYLAVHVCSTFRQRFDQAEAMKGLLEDLDGQAIHAI